MPVKGQKTTYREPRTHAQGVCIPNFILGDHAAQLFYAKFAAIKNRFPFVASGCLFAPLNRTCQKKVTMLVSESGRGKIMPKRSKLAIFGQLITGLVPKFAQRDRFDLLPGWLERVVDLTSGHLPNCCANRHAFLTNENN